MHSGMRTFYRLTGSGPFVSLDWKPCEAPFGRILAHWQPKANEHEPCGTVSGCDELSGRGPAAAMGVGHVVGRNHFAMTPGGIASWIELFPGH